MPLPTLIFVVLTFLLLFFFFFFSSRRRHTRSDRDWSSDVCSSDLNAVVTVNPNALREAEERDRERAQGKLRGPLHGIAIALKDNIHTTDMPTTEIGRASCRERV